MRQHSRVMFRAATRLRALDHSSGELLGMVADLSSGGLRLLTDEPLEVGKIYQVDLEVPEGARRFRLLELSFRCLWSRHNPRLRRCEQGCILTEPVQGMDPLLESLRLAEERARRLGA